MAERKRAKKENKEEVCEVFEIEKEGKEKTIESCGIEEKEIPKNDDARKKRN